MSFSLCCSPFSVDPSIGTLGIGDDMQVTVEFHPLKTGDHFRSLIVHYDTGKCWALHGANLVFKTEPFLSRIMFNLLCKLLLKPFLSKPVNVSVFRSEQIRGKG